MVLFLLVVGGAAVLEVHRALNHNANADIKALREKEAALRRQLQVRGGCGSCLSRCLHVPTVELCQPLAGRLCFVLGK